MSDTLNGYSKRWLSDNFKILKSNGAELFNKKIIDDQAAYISTNHEGVPEELVGILKRNRFKWTLRRLERLLVKEAKVFLAIVPASRTKIEEARVVDYKYDGNKLVMVQYEVGGYRRNRTDYYIRITETIKNGTREVIYSAISNHNGRSSKIANATFASYFGKKLPEGTIVLPFDYTSGELIWDTTEDTSIINQLSFLAAAVERVFAEMPEDIDLTSPKVIYKTKLNSGVTQDQMELQIKNGSLIVFKDGKALYNSPLDLWNPQTKVEAYIKVIEYFIAKGIYFSNGFIPTDENATNMHGLEVAIRNLSFQNLVEEKLDVRSDGYTEFYKKLYATTIGLGSTELLDFEVEVKASKTVDRLLNPPVEDLQPGTAQPGTGEK